MSDSSRRGFLKFAGVGALAAGAATVVPAAASASPVASTAPAEVSLPSAASGSLVAYVTDVHSGQVSLMVEGHEVTVTDHQLVARLAHALHGAHTSTV